MPAAIIGSITCSRMKASERPVLKMTGIPAAARASRSAMISGWTSRVTGLATGPSTSSSSASGGADGEGEAGVSGAVMAPFSQRRALCMCCGPCRRQGLDCDTGADRVTNGHCLATTSGAGES